MAAEAENSSFYALGEPTDALNALRQDGRSWWRQPWRQALNVPGGLVDRAIVTALERIFVSGTPVQVDDAMQRRVEHALAFYASDALRSDPSQFYIDPGLPEGVRRKRLGSLRGGEKVYLSFPSAYRTFDPAMQEHYDDYDSNAINRIQLWQHEEPNRPTVICVHCWCGGVLPVEARLFDAARMYKKGWNVALFTMPFHGGRTPRQARFSGQLFPSANIALTNEAFGQTVSDLRSLMHWLREEERSGPIGMMGISLGGYTTALMANLEPSLSFAIPIVAPASFADLVWHHGEKNSNRHRTEAKGMNLSIFRELWSVHCPLEQNPVVPKDRRFIVWGEGDRVVLPEHQAALWEHWERPKVMAFPGGHILQLGWHQYTRAIHRWIGDIWDGQAPLDG